MIDRDLKCACNRYAYADAFSGEYGESGYTCSACLRSLNDEVVKLWHASNVASTVYVDPKQAERGFNDLNDMINPLLKLGEK